MNISSILFVEIFPNLFDAIQISSILQVLVVQKVSCLSHRVVIMMPVDQAVNPGSHPGAEDPVLCAFTMLHMEQVSNEWTGSKHTSILIAMFLFLNYIK